MRNILITLLVFILTPLSITAKLEIPNILSDNLVLQRNDIVNIWGKANVSSTVTVTVGWSKKTITAKADAAGNWLAKVETSDAGGPYTITIVGDGETVTLNNILLGEVWICSGQSNMSMPVRGFPGQPIFGSLDAIIESNDNSDIRMFTAERSISEAKEFNVKGDWQFASSATTGAFSAMGYFYALELYKTIKVPIGIINISWGGSNAEAWMSRDLLKTFPEINLKAIDMKSKSPQRIYTALHNAMFYPISKYGFKGIIWYQGESNIVNYSLYSQLFPAMVKEWRETLGRGEVPFYYVQIAPYKYSGENNIESAMLREVQMRAQFIIPNSGMVVTADIGDKELIHAPNKQDICKRLSYHALSSVYNLKGFPYASPLYRKKEIAGNKMIISFMNADGGLYIKKGMPPVFEIAGADNVFYSAETKIDLDKRDQVEIWADEVSNPINVRYCFKNYTIGTLYNGYGIPASPFRTDNL